MVRGAASQSHGAIAGEIHPPPSQYHDPNDKHGWLRIVLRLRTSAAPFALSSVALALIVTIGFKFHLNTAVVVLLCLLVTVVHALADGLISSAVISVIAGTCLVYFFVPPLFSFRIEDPLEVVVFLVFLIVANSLAWLVSKAYEALRDSQRQLALAESVARLGLWSYDLRTKVILPSRESLRLYGLRADSSPVTWQQWLGLVHPDDRTRMERAMHKSVEQTHVWDTEFRVVWPDGSVRWLLGKGNVLLDAAGKPLRLVGVNLDITESKQAEAKLRESEERFRNMADTAPVLIWVSGPDKLCTFFNKVWLEFTGRTMEQELGEGWAQGVHRDDIERCIATYSESFDARRRFRMEYRLRRADGEYRWILDDGAPRFTSEGIFAGYIGSCVDITDKRRAEEERQKFVSLADRSLEFIGMSDLEFRPFYVNAAGLRLIGLDNLEAARQIRVQDCFFPEDLPFITDEFLPRVLREGHGEVEIRFRHFKTGDAIWMFYNVFSIYDSGGNKVGWATVSINVTERKQADRALQESAALNQAVLNSLPANIAVLKADGKIQAINEAWERFAQANGDPPACAVNIGADYLEVCRESSAHGSSDAEKALAGTQEVLAGRRPSFEMQYPCHSRAEKKWFHMLVTPLAGAGGGAVITHVNITGLKQAEQRFRLAVEAAPSGMVMADRDGKIVLVNSRTEKLFGYGRQELLGQSIDILVPESSRERHVDFRKEFFARPVARPMGVGQDLYARRKDGTQFPVEIGLNPVETEDGNWVLSSIMDITERKRAEAKLRESEERFRVIFFQAAVGIAQTSLDGQWLLLNHRFCEILGYSRDELRGKTFIDITYPDDREAALTASRKLLAGEISSWSSEKRYIGKDGITVWARLFVSLVRDQHNEAQYFVSVVEDITEKIQADRALRESRQELRALAGRLIDAEEAERKRIARELHDDINQKLAMLAFDTGSLVLAPPPSADQTREKFRDLQTRVVQLSEDVRQISHRLHPSILEDLGLTAALQEMCEEFSAREGLEVVLEQEAVPKALPVDVASCLYRVSQEALHNVLKHARANRVRLNVSGRPDGIQLCIHDTGVGFDSQSDSSRHGLGIVSMKERVRLVQGKFSIHSQPGQGTTVEIFVPLSKEAI